MIYVKFQAELFETPTSDYSHLGTLTAFAGVQERSGRFASEYKKELMRRNEKERSMGTDRARKSLR